MSSLTRRTAVFSTAFVLVAACTSAALAQKKYDPGASDTEIKVGNIMPYSGPASAYGIIGRTEAAYFKMINDQGGINGRKINFVTYDDAYSPPKAVEQARKLVESDEVLLIFNSLGTPSNTAIQKYMNAKKVPQLFVASGASKFGDPAQFPLAIMGVMAPFRNEARMYARYALEQKSDATFAVLAQNDDFGRDYLAGLKDVLGERFDHAVTVATYEATDPTIDSQIVRLKASGADVLVIAATPKFAAQAIRKTFEIGWTPMRFLTNVSVWISSVMEPAGLDAGVGIISTAYVKDPLDPAWKDDPGVKGWRDYMAKYVPDGDIRDSNFVNGYNNGMVLEHVLKAAGDDLSRDNIMKEALSIKDLELPMLLPGIKVNTGPGDHLPVEQVQFMRFTGTQWERFGEVRSTK
jgi:ABC-type branched-subunit amino acid transport system substrate-binding protein